MKELSIRGRRIIIEEIKYGGGDSVSQVLYHPVAEEGSQFRGEKLNI